MITTQALIEKFRQALEAGLPGNTEKDNCNGTVTVSPGTGLPAPVKDLAPVPAGVRVAG